jgi:hypothetical protein
MQAIDCVTSIIDSRGTRYSRSGIGSLLMGQGLVEVGVAGEAGLAVDAHAAGAADRGATRAADADGAVEARLGLQDPLEHRAMRPELDRVLVPVGRLARLRVVAAQAQGEVLGRLVGFGH